MAEAWDWFIRELWYICCSMDAFGWWNFYFSCVRLGWVCSEGENFLLVWSEGRLVFDVKISCIIREGKSEEYIELKG